MNGRRLQFGVAVVDGKIFVVGGRDGLKTLNTVECYDPATKTWTFLPPMSTHRHGLGINAFSCKILRPYHVNLLFLKMWFLSFQVWGFLKDHFML